MCVCGGELKSTLLLTLWLEENPEMLKFCPCYAAYANQAVSLLSVVYWRPLPISCSTCVGVQVTLAGLLHFHLSYDKLMKAC